MSKFKTFFLTASSLLILSGNAFAGKLEEGMDLYKSGQYEQAIAILVTFSREDPTNADVHLWLSKCYEATFQLDKSIQESKMYQNLRYKHTNQPKSEPVKNEIESDEIAANNEPLKLVYLSDDYIDKLISKRNPSDEIRNLKFIGYKTLKKILDQIPPDSESLIRMNREYEIKSHYRVASHEDLIILNKTRAGLIAFDIDTKKFELFRENDEAKIKNIEYDLKKLVKAHNDAVYAATKLINQPVFQNSDPLSFEYYQSLLAQPDEHIKNLEKKKSDFRIAIEVATKEIKNYTRSIIPQEKELKAMKERIEPSLLEADTSTLNGTDRELVMSYIDLEDKVREDKKKLLNYVAEQGILIESFSKINETIRKIKPDYVINDAPLPKQEKLMELK